jgi:glycosyltransferase involved in cell wall biosynthesis
MTVSAVIPLYNKARYIRRALESVFRQTHPVDEIIVVDDGSTDDGPEIVRAIHDPRLRLITQANAGAGIARDRGVRAAHSEFVAFLDADDEWAPEFVARVLSLFRDFPAAGIAGTRYASCRPDGDVVNLPISTLTLAPWRGILPDYFAASQQSPPLWSSATMIRKSTYEEINPQASPVKLGEDQFLWCQVAMHTLVAYDNTASAYYHEEAEGRVCSTVFYEGPLPFIALMKASIARPLPDRGNQRSIRDFIARYELYTILNVLHYSRDRLLARQLLHDCHPTPRYWARYLRLMLEAYLPVHVVHHLTALARHCRKALLPSASPRVW